MEEQNGCYHHYRDGKWRTLRADEPHPMSGLDDSEDWHDALKRLGYVKVAEYGIEIYPVSLYQSKPGEFEWLVDITLGDHCFSVYSSTFGDTLEVLSKMAPIVSANILTDIAMMMEPVEFVARDQECWQRHQQREIERRRHRDNKTGPYADRKPKAN